MDIKAFRSAVASENRHFIAQGVRTLKAEDFSDDRIWRLVLTFGFGWTRETWSDLVTDALRKHPEKFAYGALVATHPATDAWMQGDRYGVSWGTNPHGLVLVKLDSGRTRHFKPEDIQLHVV
jgi:hypothetical protein